MLEAVLAGLPDPVVALDRNGGVVALNAQWFILSEGVAAPRAARRSTIEERAAASDTDAVVMAMSRALAALSSEMASALSGLPAGRLSGLPAERSK